MSNADPCRFRWIITNPFVPWRRLETKLYTGSPTARQWKVILQPLNRRNNAYTYAFLIEYVVEDATERLRAENVIVRIFLNRKNTVSRESPHLFDVDSRHTYRFNTTVEPRPSTQPPQLDILVGIDFRSFSIEPRSEYGLIGNYGDLADLSESLRGLFNSPIYSDMGLQSTTPTDVIKVHFFILAARWGSFLTEKRLNAPPDAAVQTYIFRPVLLYILHYMYSGAFNENLMDFKDIPSRAELFQVMDWYRIYHLYQVFVRKDSRQVRKISRNMTISNNLLPLNDDISGQLLNDPSFPLLVGERDFYQVEFRIQFSLSGDAPSYSYSLRLTEGSTWCYLQVVLEFVREDPSRTKIKITPEHQREYTIVSAETVESGTIAFQNYFPLNDLRGGNSPLRSEVENRYSIRCTLSASDETKSICVWSHDKEQPQNNLKELNTLSNHMYVLMLHRNSEDLEVRCFHETSDPSNSREFRRSHWLHRAVLEARVPDWKLVLTNVEGPQSLVKESFVRSLGFGHILEYMYTGKTRPIPEQFLDEVDQFARRGRFGSLSRLVLGLRQANQN